MIHKLYDYFPTSGCVTCLLHFFRTDFGGAIITGADFTNALVDKSQQIVSLRKQHSIPLKPSVDA